MIVDVLAYGAGMTALLAVAIRLWVARRSVRPGEARILCLGGGFVALSAVVLAPGTASVQNELAHLTGLDVGKVVGDGLRMAAAGVAGLLGVSLRDERWPPPRVWIRGLLLTEVVLVTCFMLGHFHASDDGRYIEARRGAGIAYDVVRLVYPELCLGLFLLAIWPYARQLPAGPVRTGSRILAFASLIGIVWTAWTLDDISQMARAGHQDIGDDLPSALLEIAFVAAIGAGMTVTFWGRFVERTGAWLRAVRSYRAMAPLWQALCGQRVASRVPGRSPRASTGLTDRLAVSPWRASIARYRRVIEIRDAQLVLRPYQDPDPLDADQGRWSRAEAEARQILAGLAAFDSGRAAGGEGARAASASAEAGAMQHDIETEAEWLALVSDAFVRIRTRA